MKNIIKKIGKSIAIQISILSLIVGGVAFAVTFPTATPTGQTAGGKFMEYFNKIRVKCDPGQALQGFDSNFDKICVSVGTATPAPTTTFTCGSNITVGGFTYTTKIGLDGKCWTSTNMKHTPTSGNSWCYDNNSSNCNTYGRLYDGYAALDSSVCGLLGTGWTLPTETQWNNLINAGSTGWSGNKLGGLVSSLPGMYAGTMTPPFNSINLGGLYWADNHANQPNGVAFRLSNINSNIYDIRVDKLVASKIGQGLSVLCINPTITGTPAQVPTTPVPTTPVPTTPVPTTPFKISATSNGTVSFKIDSSFGYNTCLLASTSSQNALTLQSNGIDALVAPGSITSLGNYLSNGKFEGSLYGLSGYINLYCSTKTGAKYNDLLRIINPTLLSTIVSQPITTPTISSIPQVPPPPPPVVTCAAGTTSKKSNNGSNFCEFARNSGTVGQAGVVTKATGSPVGSIWGTCGSNGLWNYSVICPDKEVVSCTGGGTTANSSDGSNSCTYAWSSANAGATLNLTGTNGGTISGTCIANGSVGQWSYTLSCPNKSVPSCPAGGTMLGKCSYSWGSTTAGQSPTYPEDGGWGFGSITATCGSDGNWISSSLSYTCKR